MNRWAWLAGGLLAGAIIGFVVAQAFKQEPVPLKPEPVPGTNCIKIPQNEKEGYLICGRQLQPEIKSQGSTI